MVNILREAGDAHSIDHGKTPSVAKQLKETEMVNILREAGDAHSIDYGKTPSVAKQLKETISDIKHDVQSQIKQNRQTGFRVTSLALFVSLSGYGCSNIYHGD
nr:hypothetical protein [Tanacetum cinerariifolium]